MPNDKKKKLLEFKQQVERNGGDEFFRNTAAAACAYIAAMCRKQCAGSLTPSVEQQEESYNARRDALIKWCRDYGIDVPAEFDAFDLLMLYR